MLLFFRWITTPLMIALNLYYGNTNLAYVHELSNTNWSS